MLILDNSTVDQLSESFYRVQQPDSIESPEIIRFNHSLAKFLNLMLVDESDSDLAAIFSGTSLTETINPVALAYAGHQFGQFVPQLGDGRAILLGDVIATDGLRYDLQLKGSGQTEFSRNGDGKSALGPVLREYIVSEAMHHLGIPTSRALAAVSTNEWVYRQKGQEPAGIFTRVARAHIRIGTFEYFAARRMTEELKQLADFTITRLYPDISDADNPYLELFNQVAKNLLQLVANWQSVGFIHGVMNTDNMSLAGETIDYGPCAFMDSFQADKVFSSIDRHGRYAYNQQQNIVQWNLSLLASCLVPLVDDQEQQAIAKLNTIMESLPGLYETYWLAEFRPKFGLFNQQDDDKSLIEQTLESFERDRIDFTNGFRGLAENLSDRHQQRLTQQEETLDEAINLMHLHNPWIIPRNHQIEMAISNAYEGDFQLFHQLCDALMQPYAVDNQYQEFTHAPTKEQVVRRTFCGT